MSSGTKRFPKIFFVYDYRPDSRILADLIRQLLLGYPTEKIAWWYTRQTPTYAKPDLQAGSLYHFPLPAKLVPNQRWTKVKSLFMENIWVPLAARRLRLAIKDAKPDIVWVFCNVHCWSGVAATVAGLRGVRLHVSLWDYHDVRGGVHAMGKARARRFMDYTFQLIKQADSYDTLCPASMEEIYLRTGRKDGLMVHSGFEPNHLQALLSGSNQQVQEDEVLRLAYVGTIISEKGFFRTLAALDKIRNALKRKVVLEFFGNRNYRSQPWFQPDWMLEHGLFTDQGLIDVVRRCSWGIVVTDPEGEDLPYSRFSFPNKVGTYLSAGVPVLGFGNPQSCLIRMMQEHSFGRFTSATDAGELEKFLLESFQIKSPRELFQDGILRCAQTEFNAAEMRARLWQLWGVK
jgi:glycosyltransferase involved in cell wall biosynthesis